MIEDPSNILAILYTLIQQNCHSIIFFVVFLFGIVTQSRFVYWQYNFAINHHHGVNLFQKSTKENHEL